jgi:hypothetical protein
MISEILIFGQLSIYLKRPTADAIKHITTRVTQRNVGVNGRDQKREN